MYMSNAISIDFNLCDIVRYDVYFSEKVSDKFITFRKCCNKPISIFNGEALSIAARRFCQSRHYKYNVKVSSKFGSTVKRTCCETF